MEQRTSLVVQLSPTEKGREIGVKLVFWRSEEETGKLSFQNVPERSSTPYREEDEPSGLWLVTELRERKWSAPPSAKNLY